MRQAPPFPRLSGRAEKDRTKRAAVGIGKKVARNVTEEVCTLLCPEPPHFHSQVSLQFRKVQGAQADICTAGLHLSGVPTMPVTVFLGLGVHILTWMSTLCPGSILKAPGCSQSCGDKSIPLLCVSSWLCPCLPKP